jgi:hypothetical protein
MPKLIYSAIASLDGYVEDEEGNFDWAAPDGEVHAFVNDLERPIGTYLYGRRMYETMVFWEGVDTGTDQPAAMRDFAEIWRAAEKIVYSRSLETLSSRADSDRARPRPRCRPPAQGDLSNGHHDRGRRARWPSARVGAGRRVPSLLHADRGGRRQARTARQRPRAARTPRRAPVPERRRSSPIPRNRVTDAATAREQACSGIGQRAAQGLTGGR